VLEDHFPSIKKDLTEGKRMLPPGVMKDLLKVHKHLYGGTPTLVTGDLGKPAGDVDHEQQHLDEMYGKS
jgi:hypothetical protein